MARMKTKLTLKLPTLREMMAAPHPSAVACAAFRRGNAAGRHGPANPARARRRADRQDERCARWENRD